MTKIEDWPRLQWVVAIPNAVILLTLFGVQSSPLPRLACSWPSLS